MKSTAEMRKTSISLDEYWALVRDATVLVRDGFGHKVLELPSGDIAKIFRRKRFISSALWQPYGLRFISNCQRLATLGIHCPLVSRYLAISDIEREVLIYTPVPGLSLRQILEQMNYDSVQAAPLLASLVSFIGHLHEAGVRFRSLHLGNIILMPNGEMGLVDVTDCRFSSQPLTRRQRQHNLERLLRMSIPQERQLLITALQSNLAQERP